MAAGKAPPRPRAPSRPRAPARPPRSRSIPAALHTAVTERLREVDPDTQRTHTTRGVAAWLEEVHGVRVHHATVARLRVAVEKLTSAQVAEALREQIADKVPAMLARLDRATRRLDALVSKTKSTKDAAAATSALTRATRELATLGGIAAAVKVDVTTGGAPITDVRVTLATQLARLAGGPVPDAEGGADSEPDGG